jgi:hypothetical protein
VNSGLACVDRGGHWRGNPCPWELHDTIRTRVPCALVCRLCRWFACARHQHSIFQNILVACARLPGYLQCLAAQHDRHREHLKHPKTSGHREPGTHCHSTSIKQESRSSPVLAALHAARGRMVGGTSNVPHLLRLRSGCGSQQTEIFFGRVSECGSQQTETLWTCLLSQRYH